MTDTINPYEAPKSDIQTDANENGEQMEGLLFTASPFKLIVMTFCTWGFYELYWFYKNWVVIKHHSGRSIMPVWRTIFAPFWAFSAFRDIHNFAIAAKVPSTISAGLLGSVYLILSILSALDDPFWLVSVFTFLAILPVNAVAFRVNQTMDPGYQQNSQFSVLNIVGVLVGGLLFLLTIIMTFAPEAFDAALGI